MALSFIQWEKYIQGFPDDRLGEEFKNPGSTVPGMAPPPQNLIVSEMGNRNAARKADESVRASQGQPSGTIAEQTYNEFAEGERPVGGPGGGPPLGAGGPGGPPGGPGGPPGPGGPGGPPPGGPPMGPGGPPMGGPPPGGPPMGGPPMGGPPMGGPPMMAHGGFIPRYQEGGDTEGPGFWSGLGRMTTGAGSWEEARENIPRTIGHTALAGTMFIPGIGLVGAGGRAALGLLKGAGLASLGRGTLAMAGKGGLRGRLARLLAGKKRISSRGEARIIPGGVKRRRESIRRETFGRKVGQLSAIVKKRKRIRRAAAGAPRYSEAAIGGSALLRGGGLGIAGLLALDPWDAGEEEGDTIKLPEINTDPTDSNAIRRDRSKGYGGYEWLRGKGKQERDLERLAEYREDEGFDDFQDRANQAFLRSPQPQDFSDVYQAWMDQQDFSDIGFMDPARQGYAELPGRASGGIIGLHGGGPLNHKHDPYTGRHVGPGFDTPGGRLPGDHGDVGAPAAQWAENIGGWLSNVYGTPKYDVDTGERIYETELYPDTSDISRSLLEVQGRNVDDPFVPPDRDPSDGDSFSPLSPLNADEARELAESKAMRQALANEEWGRTETPAERELKRYQLARAQGVRDDSTNLLYADVAEAIAGSGGVPGGIASGLSKAIRGQIEQGNLARDYEGLPITAAAHRSRYSTYEQQHQVLRDIYTAASSRGAIDAEIAGRLSELDATLRDNRRLTPQALVQVSEILRQLFEDKTIDEETRKRIWSDIAGGRMRQIQAQALAVS